MEDDPMPVEGVVDGERHHLARAHFGRLLTDALIEQADNEAIEFEIVVGHPVSVRLDGGVLHIEADPGPPQLLVRFKELDFVLADEASNLSGGDSLGGALLHHSAGLIDESVSFSDVREGSPFCGFGIRRLQRADDFGLEPPGF